MTITVDIKRAKRMAFKSLLAGLVPMLWGPPAIGKSNIINQIANENDLLLIDERLSDCDPTDLKGYPSVNEANGKGFYRPMETFPLENDPLPINPKTKKPYAGWLLFLDEITNADDDVKKAAYKLLLDRMVGQKKLHPNVAIICAGNDIDHGAMAGELGTAMQSRLVHIQITVSMDSWLDWAIQNNIDHRICDYLKYMQGEALYTFRPDHTDKTFAAPRTWEFADKLIKQHGLQDEDMYYLLAGTVSPGVATEFMQFCRVYKDLPKIDEILQAPEYTPVPTELSTLFALCGTLSSALNPNNVDTMMKYISRLSPEYIFVTLMDATKRDPLLKNSSAIRTWCMKNGSDFF